jgi:putative endonuclease
MVARNYTMPGMKSEIDMIGFDGAVLAFVEVKTRVATDRDRPTTEEAVNAEKRGARQFLRARRMDSASCRFDVLAVETGTHTAIRLHKGAFVPGSNWVA